MSKMTSPVSPHLPISGQPVQDAPPRSRRFACMMYEGVLLFGVVFLAAYLFDTLTQSKHALMLRHARQLVLFVAIGVYFFLCWRRSGQTLPMKAWDMRLVGADGLPARTGQLLMRYVLMWVLPLFAALGIWGLSALTGWASVDLLIVAAPFMNFIPTFFTPGRQFAHDLISGTRLIHVPPPVKISKNP